MNLESWYSEEGRPAEHWELNVIVMVSYIPNWKTQTSHQQTTVEEVTESRYQKSTGLGIQRRHKVHFQRQTVERLPIWPDSSDLVFSEVDDRKVPDNQHGQEGAW